VNEGDASQQAFLDHTPPARLARRQPSPDEFAERHVVPYTTPIRENEAQLALDQFPGRLAAIVPASSGRFLGVGMRVLDRASSGAGELLRKYSA
jgi:hypothetical protein